MSDIRTNKSTRQRGYSLAEVLVATAIFTIIFVAALMIYDRSNKVFKQGIESSDMQQSTRVAFDQLAADLRMTGFDYDRDGRPFGLLGIQPWQPNTTYVQGNVVQPAPPNGHAYTNTDSGTSGPSAPTWPEGSGDEVDDGDARWKEKGILQYQQPDEQLEYMGPTAITIRGNLDYELDAGSDNGREPDLESEYFPVVTTANEEIVTYALKSADSSKNDDEIVFFADVAIPRAVHPAAQEAEQEITISGVDLSNANPPYTLYRFTIKTDGTPDNGTPLADNIRSLNFTYFTDTAGNDEGAPNLGAGQYDAAVGAETVERQLRRNIRSIHLNLVGMNPVADLAYTHPTDTVAPHTRQYALDSMIIPRNLGRRGMRELSVTDPGAPVIRNVCAGSCDVVYVTWDPSPKGDVLTYNILYDNDSPTGGYAYLEDAGNNIEGWVSKFILPAGTWYFKIQAINSFGYATSEDYEQITVVNTTTPESPGTFAATGGGAVPPLPNEIQLRWAEVTLNDAAANHLTCADGAVKDQVVMPGSERRYYRVYRGTTANFDPLNPAESTKILDEYSTTQPAAVGADLVLHDLTAANCKPYWYRILTADYCARNAAWNNPAQASTGESAFFPPVGDAAMPGIAESSVAPAKPGAPSITNTDCTGANCDLTLGWPVVTKDVDGTNVFIDTYAVVAEKKDSSGIYQLDAKYPVNNGANTLVIQNQKSNEFYKYTVVASQCSLDSVASDPVYFPCPFTDTVTLGPVGFNAAVTAGAPWIVNTPAAISVTGSVAMASFEFWVEQFGIPVEPPQTAGAGTTANFTIPVLQEDEVATVYVRVTNSSGCVTLETRYVLDEAPPPCPVATLNASIGNSGTNTLTYNLANPPTGAQLTLKRVKVKWDKTLTPSPNGNTTIGSLKTDGFNAALASGYPTSVGSFFTHLYDVQAAAPKVDAGETAYPVVIAFSTQANKKLLANPITSVCLEYQTTLLETLHCGVQEPGTQNGSTCTIP